MTEQKTYKLETIYYLKQPLSHSGGTESATSFLNTVGVINGDKPETVFGLTGNSIRGTWRDYGSLHLFKKFNIDLPRGEFSTFMAGGTTPKKMINDTGRCIETREKFPLFSVVGGCTSDQIYSGLIGQTFAWPVCLETDKIVPRGKKKINQGLFELSWRKMTADIEFSRMDDSKGMNGKYIEKDNKKNEKKKPKENEEEEVGENKSEPVIQMRYGVEYMMPGTQLWHLMYLTCDTIELGATVRAIYEWAKRPFLGGMHGKGFGLTDMDMEISVDGKTSQFIAIKDGTITLESIAKNAMDEYDKHLESLDPETVKSDIIRLMGT